MSRSANTKLFGLKSKDNKVSVTSLSCETDFVSGTDMFKNFSIILVNLLTENPAKEVKEEEFEKIKFEENKIDKAFDNLSILEGLKILISKTQENCKIGIMKNFEYTPENENTKIFIGTYLHSSPSNYPNLGVKASFVVLSAESGAEPINKHAEEELKELSSRLAMQVVACNSKYLMRSDIPIDVLEHETKIIQERIEKESKPELTKKLVDAAVISWIEEKVLNEQYFVIQDYESSEGKINVQNLIAKYSKKLNLKNLQLKDFKLFV